MRLSQTVESVGVFRINTDMQVIDKLFKKLILFTARAA